MKLPVIPNKLGFVHSLKLTERVGCSKSGVLLLHREPGVYGVPGLQERADGPAGGGRAAPHASPSRHSLRFRKADATVLFSLLQFSFFSARIFVQVHEV